MKSYKNISVIDSKPQYYNDYFMEEKNNLLTTYEDSNSTSITLLTLFIFCGSITDVIYSYMELDSCQKLSYYIVLNDWLRINGIFGIIFYFCIIIILYCISNIYKSGYERLINQNTKRITERQELFYKIFLTVNTIIMLILFSVGFYLFFFHFGEYCRAYAITIYLWIRILSGIVSSIIFLIYINY